MCLATLGFSNFRFNGSDPSSQPISSHVLRQLGEYTNSLFFNGILDLGLLKRTIDSGLIYDDDESFVNNLLQTTNIDSFVSHFYDRCITTAGCSPESANRESRFKFERATAECHGLITALVKALKSCFEVIRGASEKLKGMF